MLIPYNIFLGMKCINWERKGNFNKIIAEKGAFNSMFTHYFIWSAMFQYLTLITLIHIVLFKYSFVTGFLHEH